MRQPTKAVLRARIAALEENFAISEAECNRLARDLESLRTHLEAGADYDEAIENGRAIKSAHQYREYRDKAMQEPLENLLTNLSAMHDALDCIIH